MPGCLTPTEILTAWKAGANAVKVFPCDTLGGAKYLKTLKTLFPHIEMMPTGGVSCVTIADFSPRARLRSESVRIWLIYRLYVKIERVKLGKGRGSI